MVTFWLTKLDIIKYYYAIAKGVLRDHEVALRDRFL
jgi:hypothetical protein